MSTIDINAIFVGFEEFTVNDWLEVSDAITRTRTIYATVGVTVGQVHYHQIPVDKADGRQNIDDDGEAEALTDEWTFPDHALDVFFVRTYAGTTVGLSRVNGPCDKDAKGMDGSVIAIEGSSNVTGLATAHEVAHYLGLDHESDPTNLMFGTVGGTVLRADQGNRMKGHCFVY